jgi:hypothetical protein
MARKASWLLILVGFSRAILHDRPARRNFILYVIGAVLAVFALGNWPLRDWLGEAPLRFLVWWGGCAILAVFLFLLGLYDFLQVIRENRNERD